MVMWVNTINMDIYIILNADLDGFRMYFNEE